jgi:DNA-binding transcriptional LysR family regulator
MDKLDEWRIFATVASKGSFSQAARQHGRSPQAVTRAIVSLEQRLGTRLLNRTTRSVSLTDDGAQYLERGRRLLLEFDALEAPIAELGPLRGSVTVTAPLMFGRMHVEPLVLEFLREHPEIAVRLVLHDRVLSLAEDAVDVAVRIGKLPDSALRAHKLGQVSVVVCASPAYLRRRGTPRTPEQLGKHDCVAVTGVTPIPDLWPFARAGARERSVRVHPRLTVNGSEAGIDAALAGVGIVRVLSYQVTEQVRAKRLRLLLREFEPEPMPIQLVQLAGIQTAVARAFVELAVARLRQLR